MPGTCGEDRTSGDTDLSRRSTRYLYWVSHAAVHMQPCRISDHGRWMLRRCASCDKWYIPCVHHCMLPARLRHCQRWLRRVMRKLCDARKMPGSDAWHAQLLAHGPFSGASNSSSHANATIVRPAECWKMHLALAIPALVLLALGL